MRENAALITTSMQTSQWFQVVGEEDVRSLSNLTSGLETFLKKRLDSEFDPNQFRHWSLLPTTSSISAKLRLFFVP